MSVNRQISSDRFWHRVLLLLVAIPFFYLLIYGLSIYQYLFLCICCVAASVIGSREMVLLFRRKSFNVDLWLALTIAAVFPVTAYLENIDVLAEGFALLLLIGTLSTVLISSLIKTVKGQDLNLSLATCSVTFFSGIYPSVFIGFIVRMTDLGNAKWILLTFFLSVFINDIAGYVVGKLVKGRTAIGLTASPSKTVLGYLAGITASALTILVAKNYFPGAPQMNNFTALLGGSIIGVGAAVGDLVESMLKRSAETKDSGDLIPGRGGMLDSIDSLLFCAPVFFYWMRGFDWRHVYIIYE